MVPLYRTVLLCTVLPRYYRFSAALCMMGATVGVASQYFGDPIRWGYCHLENRLDICLV